MRLAWQDHAVVVGSLALTLLVGLITSQRQNSNDEFFLARRQLPWWAMGLSLLMALTSGVACLTEPAEVWTAGIMPVVGRLMAVPATMAVVCLFVIPFLMRFRFTSVYEYLEFRFNYPARILGVAMFSLLCLGMLPLAILTTARGVSAAAGIPPGVVIATAGLIATAYTVMGGMRAVAWTSVFQAGLIFGGIALCLIVVAGRTGSHPWDWYQQGLASRSPTAAAIPLLDPNLLTRPSAVTLALGTLIWQLCLHSGNPMSVQRAFATGAAGPARSSFVLASLLGVALTVLLLLAGLAGVFLTTKGLMVLPAGLDPARGGAEMLSAMIASQLPVGLAGVAMAGVLAAVMGFVALGLHSLSTVICAELTRSKPVSRFSPEAGQELQDGDGMLGVGRWVTLAAGVAVTAAAYLLAQASGSGSMAEWLPRVFPCLAAPLGGMFLLGMFLPFVTGRAILPAALFGTATAAGMAFGPELFPQSAWQSWNAAWVMPAALWVMALGGVILSLLDRPSPQQTFGLTVFTQHQEVLFEIGLNEPGEGREALA